MGPRAEQSPQSEEHHLLTEGLQDADPLTQRALAWPPGRWRLACLPGPFLAVVALAGAGCALRQWHTAKTTKKSNFEVAGDATQLAEGGEMLSAFEQCGGEGLAESSCQQGCLCTSTAEGDDQKPVCTPPDGYDQCDEEGAKNALREMRDKLKPLQDELADAEQDVRDIDAQTKEATQEESRAKRALHDARATLKEARKDAREEHEGSMRQLEAQLAKAKKTLAESRKQATMKGKEYKKEAARRLREAAAATKAAEKKQGAVIMRALKERDAAVAKLRSSLHFAEERQSAIKADAEMERKDTVSTARQKAEMALKEKTSTLTRTKEALSAKKEAGDKIDTLEAQASEVEEEIERLKDMVAGESYVEGGDDGDEQGGLYP